MILQAAGLSIGYRGTVIGRDLAVALPAGDVLVLLGPNGGGKTTLLKTLLGLLSPLAGEVRLEDRPLAAFSVRERARRIAYVPQVHVGTFGFSVEEVVLMGRTAHGGFLSRPSARDEAAAWEAMERLGIGALAGRPYTLISGGERQLVLIARALAQEPRIIVLDEPTANLDFGNQGKVLREMRRLSESGLAVLFTTHDPNHALRYAQRVLMIGGGRAIYQGPVQEGLERGRLSRLYGSEVEEIARDGERAFYVP